MGRLSWIICVVPKCLQKLLREAEGSLTQRTEGSVNLEVEIIMVQPQARECQQPPEVEKAQTSERAQPCERCDLTQ